MEKTEGRSKTSPWLLPIKKRSTWLMDFTILSAATARQRTLPFKKRAHHHPTTIIPIHHPFKTNMKKKNANISRPIRAADDLPPPPAAMAEELRSHIVSAGGLLHEAALVIEKVLSKTDVDPYQGRLSLPFNQVRSPDFLAPREKDALTRRTNGKPDPIPVTLLQLPSFRLSTHDLKRWDMKKPHAKTSSSYVICHEWKSVIEHNQLKVGQRVQIWSFRLRSELFLAMIRVDDERTNER